MKRFVVYVCLCCLFVGGGMSFAQDKDLGTGKAGGPGAGQKVEKPSIVQVPPIALRSEEKTLLNDLRTARKAGDSETARELQVTLDALHGMTSRISLPEEDEHQQQAGLVTDRVESKDLRKWATGDVRINSSSIDVREPSMVSTPAGVLYVAVQNNTNGQVYIYRSTDGGQSWTYWFWLTTGGTTSRHPSIAYAEKSSTEKFVYVAMEGTTSSSKWVDVFRINTVGEAWIAETVATTSITTNDIYPEICTDYPDFTILHYVYVTYALKSVDYYPVYFSRSTDFGNTWSTPTNITGGSENSSWEARPDITYGTSNGDLFVVFEKPALSEIRNWVTQSTNSGNSWGTPVSLSSGGSGKEYHPRVSAAFGNNSVLVAYTRDFQNSGDLDINYAYTTNGGTSWSKGWGLSTSSTSDEDGVELSRSDSLGNFHAAFTRYPEYDVRYTQIPTSFSSGWTTLVTVNEEASASTGYPRPAVCANPTKPEAQEAGIAWTDFRDTYYDVFFDSGYLSDSYLLWTK
ncbi:hypothetical protein U27_04750 [Candidatus Vecturithrix granuli]|uniref:Exo-alpha-sialidase n=1 Tax=Vecturithrix granuli TaxID=1499967 RepID=A0A081BZM8_VECG1|nr:hypothetical protein U27_04750 [Candidatus Vecturithrix granuli]